MSRIGKNPIAIPDKVDVKINGNTVSVKGPKGSLSREFHPEVRIHQKDNSVLVERYSDAKFHRSLHGTVASHIRNMIKGVTDGFEKALIVSGIGYRAVLKGNTLSLSLGYSNPVDVELPQGIEAEVEDRGLKLKIKGINKEQVGQFAAEIRDLRRPEPYKGKGIRYSDEHIIRKAGKRAV